MEADWDEINSINVPPPGRQNLPLNSGVLAFPASTLAFDTQQELLWIGNEYGRLASFHSYDLQRYTSFRAHSSKDGPAAVKQLLFHERGVISIAQSSVHLSSRRGWAQWHLTTETTRDLRCMSYMGKDYSSIIIAGHQNVMLKVDVEKGQVVEEIPTEHRYTMMKYSHYICAATSTGSVNILDPDTLRIVKTLNTNNIGICDMDARNNYLVICGLSSRQQGAPMPAGLANVYDLRAMAQLPPIPFHAGAAHVQMHPRMSTTCILASQHGQLQVVDIMNSNAINLRQLNISTPALGLVLAPSGEAFAISEADGTVHLWGSLTKLQFAEYSNSTEFADTVTPVPMMDIDADMPLNTIGMPYYRDQLLSVWPSHQLYEVGNPPLKIDPGMLGAFQAHEIGLWGHNPRNTRRNQAEKTRIIESNGSTLVAPKFLSEKAREIENNQNSERRISDINESLANAALNSTAKAEVPVIYRNVEIKYSKFGVDDFDFEYYNKTPFSGLETHIANSYTNPLLQLLRFTPLTRNLALRHAASTCFTDTCLLCEMGFLFDMLDKAEGQSCQATNFLKTFSSLPEAAKLGLLEEQSHSTPLTMMMQSANRFLLEHISADFKKIAHDPLEIDQECNTFAIDALSSIRCVHCHNDTIRPGSTYVNDMIYPLMSTSSRLRNQVPTFSQILKASIERETQTRGWCDKCRRYQQLATRKTVRGVPDVLMINAAVKTLESKQYWAIRGWLPERIGLIVEKGKVFCFEGEDLRLHIQRGLHEVTVYALVGIVADVNGGEHQKSHLVSLIDVAISERSPTEEQKWHLFNDFLVRKVSKEDALQFTSSWKSPSIITYQVTIASHAVDDSWKRSLDTNILYYDWSINNQPPKNCRVLRSEKEAPGPGSYVAIDTEFVALQQEEIEIKADGDREIVRPTRLGLARVSVLRGSGVDEGLPFINDYITINEQIVDYLTKWSGVQEGDLDPHYSSHNLVPLKVAYKKLWILLNLGCIFIGHGLPKDFRTINIHVPKSQVLDTVDLFYIRARQRKLSLRFLAWYLLKEDIQQDNHDSIEDARSALRLWRKYEEFRDAGIVEPMVEEVYREGKKWGYKPPGEGQTAVGRRHEVRSMDGGNLVVPVVLDGRETPDILQGHSGPGTPVGRKGTGRGSEYFESPLR